MAESKRNASISTCKHESNNRPTISCGNVADITVSIRVLLSCGCEQRRRMQCMRKSVVKIQLRHLPPYLCLSDKRMPDRFRNRHAAAPLGKRAERRSWVKIETLHASSSVSHGFKLRFSRKNVNAAYQSTHGSICKCTATWWSTGTWPSCCARSFRLVKVFFPGP